MSGNGFDPDFASAGQWARLYRAHGVQVVPACAFAEVARGKSWKRPLLKSWTDFQDSLVPDAVFERWYGPGGQYATRENMGVICGRASNNLFVIDLDTHRNASAAEWWRGLMAVHNNSFDLETVEQRTGGGGLQKLFRAPLGWVAPTNKTSIGVDIRGQGGFAMLAPSLHESGAHYEWLDGRSPDDLEVTLAPDWLLAEVETLVRVHGGVVSGQLRPGPDSPQGSFDAFGHQTDARESKMRDLVWAAVVDWRRECPIKPSDDESTEKAQDKYRIYEDLVSPQVLHDPNLTKTQMLERENRGPAEFWAKWQYAMRQWDAEVAEEACKPKPVTRDLEEQFERAEQQAKIIGNLYQFLDVDQIMNKADPVWIVDGLINEKCLGFIFGPHSSLKTFIALDLALCLAAKIPAWWNRKVNQSGAVVYLCREGTASLKFRIKAWELHRKAIARGAPFFLIEHPINFMNASDVGTVIATVEAILARAGMPIAAVFVDTVSRVLPGAEENLQRDMSLFVGACEAIQTRFGCIVVGIHHTNKSGGMRGSTVIPGAGDFLLEMQREPGAMDGTLVVVKVKDGEDGIDLPFKVSKIELGGIVPRSSLVVDPVPAGTRKALSKDGLPDRAVCIEILTALAQAWFQKMPWCKSAQGARPAVDMIMGRWKLERGSVKRLLTEWLANGVIEYELYDSKNKLHGYRKITDL